MSSVHPNPKRKTLISILQTRRVRLKDHNKLLKSTVVVPALDTISGSINTRMNLGKTAGGTAGAEDWVGLNQSPAPHCYGPTGTSQVGGYLQTRSHS